jgi:hypothetical protein
VLNFVKLYGIIFFPDILAMLPSNHARGSSGWTPVSYDSGRQNWTILWYIHADQCTLNLQSLFISSCYQNALMVIRLSLEM